MPDPHPDRAGDGQTLWERLRPYVEARVIWTDQVKFGVSVIVDHERKEGEPWTNPDRPEVRVHPRDYSALKAYGATLSHCVLSFPTQKDRD